MVLHMGVGGGGISILHGTPGKSGSTSNNKHSK